MAASGKVPEQMEAIRVPRAAAARSASRTAGGSGAVGSAVPGTITVSASRSPSRSQGARSVKAPASTSGRSAHTRTR